ncbi:hypothetical protein N7507_004849 [Penicillium longicatenatum]|nr:hypothetical protein N7507_004849 [Penicillium longicatenatum]
MGLAPDMPAPEQSGLPGFTLPLDYLPKRGKSLFRPLPLCPHALQYPVKSAIVHREILMMRVMNAITDKPEWELKVFDEEITAKWREEISNSGEDISAAMMGYIIKELQWKANHSKSDGFTTVFDIGVVKSDTAIPEELRKALVDEVAPLENIPDDQKDYHPRSNQKVLDLVHQSLFPLVYGRSRILPDESIGLEDCLGTIGQGELLTVPSTGDEGLYSRKFQWLPCDVELRSTETKPECRITSYINNLHPGRHLALYNVIEKVIARTIPLWNRTLTGEKYNNHRIEYSRVEKDHDGEPEPDREPEESDRQYWLRRVAWERTGAIKQPEPKEFTDYEPDERMDIQKQFGDTGLQVIVKLANIELSPEKPEYEGGSWHIEGQLNERICATAIYYYDSENITESILAFRQRANENAIEEVYYDQGEHEFLQDIYGFSPNIDGYTYDAQITQDLGGVVCRQGRLLTFPNVIQHCVAPFSLANRSKPGHRKILALFLVDPHVRIISTANIPPQQEDWGRQKYDLAQKVLSKKLPAELRNMVCDEGILQQLMSMDEAKELRLELMEERSAKSLEQNEIFEKGDFNLCEH